MSPGTLAKILHPMPHVEESTPFGPEVFVHKVGGKMFAPYSPGDEPLRLNLKCHRQFEITEVVTAGWVK